MSHGSTSDKIDPTNDFAITPDSKYMLSVGPDESHLQSATITIALKLENVKKVFEPRSGSAKRIVMKALDGVSFEVRGGEFVSIVGPSGSGKTTLLNVIGALDRPSSGKVFINGQDIFLLDDASLSDIRNRLIGFIFQSYNLINRISVQENIEFPAVFL